MASSGTFTSGRYGTQYGPWLTLAWTQVSQSVANNTTTLDLTLRFHWDRNISLSFNNKGGSLQGHSYTSSGSASGTSGSRVLKTQRVTISHNSNGTRSVTLSGNITSLNLNWSGNRVNTMSVSGTANLNTIPRASTLSAFSFNAHLKNDVANQINYTIDRKSTGFRHQIQLRDGNTVIRTWDNVDSDDESILPLTDSEVNTLLNRMRSSTTKSYTLRVATRSGVNGGWIGSAVSRNATATVHADVKPGVSAVTLSQTGNPVSTHTLQGFSKIEASFTRSAGYGATISSSSIQVRRRSGGADSQTINSNSGTTTNPVSLNGVYDARGTARDSRGRTTNTEWATIIVTPYESPTITDFSAVRDGSTATTVNISRATTHTVLGTSNHLTYTIQRRQGTGAWTNVNTGDTGSVTTSGDTGVATSTGNDVMQSYEFRLVVEDKLGGRAESLQFVSTQRVVLDIHQNEGVGIGKIREQGVLDVDGEAFFKGKITLESDIYGSGLNLMGNTPTGHGYISYYGSDNERKAFSGFGTLEGKVFAITNESGGGINLGTSGSGKVMFNGLEPVEKGNNVNGRWVKFYDGTLICSGKVSAGIGAWTGTDSSGGFGGYYNDSYFPLPHAFIDTNAVVVASPIVGGYFSPWVRDTTVTSTDYFAIGLSKMGSAAISLDVVYQAIGRWK